METITLEDAQARLPELLAGLRPGEEVRITAGDRPVARLVAEPAPRRAARRPGSAIGRLVIVAEDDEHLGDFRDYMP